MNKIEFYKILSFKFNNKWYQLFKTKHRKVAILRINDDGKYSYPSIEEFISIINIFETNNKSNAYNISFGDEKNKVYKFTPKVTVKHNGKLKQVMLTSSIVLSIIAAGIGGYQIYDSFTYDNPYVYDYRDYSTDISTLTNNVADIVDEDGYTVESEENRVISDEERFPNSEGLFEEHVGEGFIDTRDYSLINSGKSKYLQLFNNKYFSNFFGVDNYSLDEVINAMESNKNISSKFKEYMKNYITIMYNYYPNLDWRVFTTNIKTLKIELLPSNSYDLTSINSEAFYDYQQNLMSLQENFDFKDESGRLVINHELGHLFNTLYLKTKKYEIHYYFKDNGEGVYVLEALDVIFTTAPFENTYSDKRKENLGYPLITNEMRVIIDSLNQIEGAEYSIEKFVSGNVYDLEDSLKAAMPNDIHPQIILSTIDYQWYDYSYDSIQIGDKDYSDLFKYITRLYIKANLTNESNYSEIEEHKEKLIERLKVGIKDNRYVFENDIEEEFNNFINLNKIEPISNKR